MNKKGVEGSPRRNSSLVMTNTAQMCIPMMNMTFIEAPVIGMRLMSIREGREPKNI